ncbi:MULTISPECIES: lytic polysaccharide monooxygenase [unclassified Streptomyces]|uniref:lytic polysaccharide monooxygenase auxiliary activity family 9 protein n=1 Tax=unclassified Streptomyces TaxID=2593676 RepID=UPI00081DF6F3|nr:MULTISPECIES: lytic polysaccharide monooxygenase [unclassified Streptomyces]MYZ34862.1 chitin-binding protein [Streptomyces sp. SID4917]SCF70885.1 chitin-binding protein [Streptomyces sp. MnatMP-M17]
MTRPPLWLSPPRRAVLLALLAVLPALLLIVGGSGTSTAHGTPMKPASRTFMCWRDGLTSTGEIKPVNPACKAAVAESGTTPLYNWFSVLRSDGAGRTKGFIPDGQLCSGGNTTFSGFNQARNDWPLTHLTSGARLDFSYNAWAAHPGWFYVYVTKDGFDPTKTFTWDDLEAQPFLTVDHPAVTGTVGTVDGAYKWSGNLPGGKTGRHIIYMVWQRSDSNETFYSCSDVVFDGGNGEVTGVGEPGTTPPTDPPTDPTATCTATRKITNSWAGGYQAEITVKNTGTNAILGWMVEFALPTGQKVDSLWNGTATYGGQEVMVHNADWNGSLAVGASTTFSYVASGGPPDTAATAPCSVH